MPTGQSPDPPAAGLGATAGVIGGFAGRTIDPVVHNRIASSGGRRVGEYSVLPGATCSTDGQIAARSLSGLP